jgi:ribonucleoside-diphosphate reductase alpha chain
MWDAQMRDRIIAGEGSIQGIEAIPAEIRELYKTAWELPQKVLIDMAADRGAFICQSQSLNLFLEDPTIGKLSSMYMYAWKRGVKTTYYLRSRAKTSVKKTTISGPDAPAGASAAGKGSVASAQGNSGAQASAAAVEAAPAKKQYTAEEAVVCSLENPEACEACQ